MKKYFKFEKISLEKVHNLLKKLAEYVMNKVPTNRKVDARFEQVERKLEKIKEEKADKKDVRAILNGMDAQAKQLDIIRTEQTAFHSAFNRIEKKVTNLEEKETGYRIRDAEE